MTDEPLRVHSFGEYSNTLAWDINNNGVVVGGGQTPLGAWHAFIFDGTSMTDLNSLIPAESSWTLSEATAINDAGQIVAVGIYQGSERAFRLDPVPEPSTADLFLIALGGLLLCALRRRLVSFLPSCP